MLCTISVTIERVTADSWDNKMAAIQNGGRTVMIRCVRTKRRDLPFFDAVIVIKATSMLLLNDGVINNAMGCAFRAFDARCSDN